MRKILIIAAAMSLSACAGLRDRASDYICDNRNKVAAGARAALLAADEIRDPGAREAAKLAANALLDAVAKCPPRIQDPSNDMPAPNPTPTG